MYTLGRVSIAVTGSPPCSLEELCFLTDTNILLPGNVSVYRRHSWAGLPGSGLFMIQMHGLLHGQLVCKHTSKHTACLSAERVYMRLRVVFVLLPSSSAFILCIHALRTNSFVHDTLCTFCSSTVMSSGQGLATSALDIRFNLAHALGSIYMCVCIDIRVCAVRMHEQ